MCGIVAALLWPSPAMAGGPPSQAEHRSLTMADGVVVRYRLLVPPRELAVYPVLLALPPGRQTAEAVDWGIENLYRDEAVRRGWVVVSPVAPGGRLFFEGSEKYLPELLREVAREFPPEGGKFHLAGVSNGGLAAFRVAVLHPELFRSIAVFPGWPSPDDLPILDRIAGVPLRMWAGEKEAPRRLAWMKSAERLLRARNSPVELSVLPGQGHDLTGAVGGGEIFDFLEKWRPSP